MASGPTLGENLPFVLAVLTLGVFAGMRLQKLLWQLRRSDRQRWNNRRYKKGGKGALSAYPPRQDPVPAKVPDAADQLRTVMGADFTAQPLLNNGETRLFKALDKLVLEMRPDWQVMAQVSLGEVLRSKDKAAYLCINSKRVDLLIVDAECKAVRAIEYQGGGHHQGTAAARDAVKKEALRRAGIGYEEIVAGHHTPAELRRLVEKVVRGTTAV